MNRTHRSVVLTALAAAAILAACRRQQEPAPVPEPAPAPVETCDQRCRDSIAAAEAATRRRADSIEAANRAAADLARRIEAAKAALTARVLFDYDQSEIRADQRAILDQKLPVLRANPGIRLLVSGHADERGSDEYNIALGQQRAAAVRRYLTDNGIDPSRIQITSYGEERPATTGTDENAYAQNRRAEFEVVAGGENITPP
ncbi:MAG TPA: peptidoglycan-associated lipoprotein Pal [Gemmatimonadaceae bacterium]|nr:peptidoglycan-associated lipoprotein Pal [Gemmatimonadaceae bacterium]